MFNTENKTLTILLVSLFSIILISGCVSHPIQTRSTPTLTPEVPTSTPVPTLTFTPTATPDTRLVVIFGDGFNNESIDEQWEIIEGQPILQGITGKGSLTSQEKLTLQINESLPDEFIVQFDLHQCGFTGPIQVTIGNQIRFDFLDDLGTNQYVQENNQWVELPHGFIHRCAAHIRVVPE